MHRSEVTEMVLERNSKLHENSTPAMESSKDRTIRATTMEPAIMKESASNPAFNDRDMSPPNLMAHNQSPAVKS